jgi:hypothetical protein
MKELDIYELFKMARKGTLPADFKDWDRADKRGLTVAHEAAIWGHLPANFDRWELVSKQYWPEKVKNDSNFISFLRSRYQQKCSGYNVGCSTECPCCDCRLENYDILDDSCKKCGQYYDDEDEEFLWW